MRLWKLTFSNYGALKRGHTFLFSTGQIVCQKRLCHIAAMIVLKRFRRVTHCYVASFSLKTFFCKTNNIFYSLKTKHETKPNNDSESTSKIKVSSSWKVSKFCLRQQLFAFKKFCMETILLNISKITNTTDFIKTILKNSCRILLETCHLTASTPPVFLLRAVEF